jgi:UDP-N-acetylmuramoyl-tripeptide--D-alanyl-D-alanine ligase
MRFDAARLAADLGGELVGVDGAQGALRLDGLSIDSRALVPGQMFAAVADERDGHEFVPAARAAGAPAVLVARLVDDGPSILVPDVERALFRLGGIARRRLPELVVGITGSVGKTTTKDLLASVLTERFATAASHRSFNNELGVPITLANASEDTEATVIEMGARGHGHIAQLCAVALPTVGVVTAVQAVHTEHMGGEHQIAVAKRELVEMLPPDGLAVLHDADPRVAAMAAHTRAAVLTFGGGPAGGDTGDVWADEVTVDQQLRPRFVLRSAWGSVEVQMGARGVHNVPNALAAATVALWTGMSLASVAAGLGNPIDSPWRMELHHTASGATVLNDAYNAGPASMAAALRSLATLPASRRLAVLGVMAELGGRSVDEHARIAGLAADLGIEVLAVATDLYGVAPLDDAPAAVAAVRAALADGPSDTAVLVKGSRVAGLEVVARELLDDSGGARANPEDR